MNCCNNCLGKTLPCELETGPPTALYVHRPDASPPPIPKRSASGFAPLPASGYIEPEEDMGEPQSDWKTWLHLGALSVPWAILIAWALGAFK